MVTVFVNLIVPGAGPALLGQWRQACLTQLLLIISITALCWSRIVFEPWAVKMLLGMIAAIYTASSVLCFASKPISSFKPLRQALLAIGFIVVSISVMTAGYIHKDRWLGIHIYFVSSISMYPTLKPGQLILLDTWAYRDKTPSLNDVVVFEHGIKKRHLVKRINYWPNGELTKKELWYVMGDNHSFSQDSRYFGGITTKKMIAEVKLVLVAFNKNNPLQVDFLAAPVN